MDILEGIRMLFNICGIEITNNIESLIRFNINQTKQSICNYINQKEMPEELNYVCLTRSLGLSLKTLSSMGLLNSENFKIEPIITSMTRGDISMSFKGLSYDEKINTLINTFEIYGEKELNNFRVIKW